MTAYGAIKMAAPMSGHPTGYDLLRNPRLNKGTAFTAEERRAFGLEGLLPPAVTTLALQVARRHAEIRRSIMICRSISCCRICMSATRHSITRS